MDKDQIGVEAVVKLLKKWGKAEENNFKHEN